MSNANRRTILLFLLLISSLIFIFHNFNFGYVLESRLVKVYTILLVGISIAVSSLIFQTITNNRILTPGIIGFDSLFLLIQAMMVFIINMIPSYQLFLLNIIVMICISTILFNYVFIKHNIFKSLLLGTVMSILFRTMCDMLYSIMDPDAFDSIQATMFINFNIVDSSLLPVSTVLICIQLYYIYKHRNELDILALGDNISNSLGVDYKLLVRRLIFSISILVSVSTALVGPITFLGLFIANITRILFKTYKHEILIPNSTIIGCLFLLIGVYLNDRIFINANLPILIDGFGALYFIYLCTRSFKHDSA